MTYMENQMPKKPYAGIRDRMQQEIDNLERKLRDMSYGMEILEDTIQEKKRIIALQQITLNLYQEIHNER